MGHSTHKKIAIIKSVPNYRKLQNTSFSSFSVKLSLGNELKLTTEDLSRTLDSTFVEFIPARSEFSVRDYNRRVRQGTYYWSMPRQFLGKKVRTFLNFFFSFFFFIFFYSYLKKVRTSWKSKWTYFIFLSLFFLSLIIFIASMFLLELFFNFLLYTIINCSFPLSFFDPLSFSVFCHVALDTSFHLHCFFSDVYHVYLISSIVFSLHSF